MLSRVADALFWMSRYLERAEQVARLIDVCFHLELDLHGLAWGDHELHWSCLAAILQQPTPPAGANGNGHALPALLSHRLTFDLNNPTSVMACVARARGNARSIRGTLNNEVWKELNKLYWQLSDADFSARARESPHEFYQAVETGSCLFQGVCDATLNHDEGWQFIQLGKYLERADKTLRIIDAQSHLLHGRTEPADLPLMSLRWAGVLRSCRAYEAYQRLYVGRVEPDKVVALLLLHPDCPRSVRFCFDGAVRALAAIEGPAAGRELSRVERTLGRVLSDLQFAEPEQLLRGDLHAFLAGVLERCAQVTRAVQDQYSLH